MTERHIVKLHVQLKDIKLSVKFPCKLSFELVSQNNRKDSTQQYELKFGQCHPNQSLDLETDATFNKNINEYEKQKFCISIRIVSGSGTIPAGRAFFNPFGKENMETTQSTVHIEKCPDKMASVTFTHYYQLLRVEQNNRLSLKSTGTIQKYDLLKHSKSTDYLKFAKPNQTLKESYLYKPVQSSNSRVNNTILSPKIKKIGSQEVNLDVFQKSMMRDKLQKGDFDKDRSRVIQQINFNDGYKSIGDPFERAEQQKELAKLRSQLKILKSDEYSHKQQKIKDENFNLTMELEKTRQKIRIFQRKQRQTNLLHKQLKDEIQKYKSRISTLEYTKNDLQIQLQAKEKSLRQCQHQHKKQENNCQELQAVVNNLSKKLEYKENYFQEQLKKMNQKINTIEGQNQKLLFEQNSVLSKIEESQRKNQSLLRQKQRNHQEQKNKLLKLNQSFSHTIQDLKKQLESKQKYINELVQQLVTSVQSQNKQKQLINTQEVKIQILSANLRRQEQQRQEYERDIIQYREIESDRSFIKKKYTQTLNELTHTNQKLERTIAELNLNADRIVELEHLLVERTRQRDVLNGKNNVLKRQLDSIKHEEQKILREAQTLTVQNVSYQQKFNDIRAKWQKQRTQWQYSQKNFEKQMIGLSKGRQMLDSENEQQRQIILNLQNQISQLSKRLKQSADTIMELNELILIQKQSAKKVQENYHEQSELNTLLTDQMQDMESRQKLQFLELKKKEQELYHVNKLLMASENDNYLLRQKQKQVENTSEDQKRSDQKRIQQKQRQIQRQNEQIIAFTIELESVKDELAQCQNIIHSKTAQNSDLSESIQQYIQDLTNKNYDLKQKIQRNQELEEKVDIFIKEEESIRSKADLLAYQNDKIKKEWSQYKEQTVKAMTFFLNEIGKEGNSTDISFLIFPDENLSFLQTQTIHKVNGFINKLTIKNEELFEQKTLLQNQINNLKEQLYKLEAQNENKMLEHTEESSKTIHSLEKVIDSLKTQLTKEEQQKMKAIFDIEKLNISIKQKNQFIDELKNDMQQLRHQLEQKYSELKQAEENIVQLKSAQIKIKASMDAHNMQISEQNSTQFQRMKHIHEELEKKVDYSQRLLKEKQELIKKLELDSVQSDYNRQKAKETVVELQQTIKLILEDKRQEEKKNHHLQQQIKTLSAELLESKSVQQRQSLKNIQLQHQLNKRNSDLTNAEVQVQKLRGEINILKGSNEELSDKILEIQQKYSKIIQKWQKQLTSQRQKTLELSSKNDLSQFKIHQQQTQINKLIQELQQYSHDIINKKDQLTKIKQQCQNMKNKELTYEQKLSFMKFDQHQLQEQNRRVKEFKQTLQNQLQLLQFQVEELTEANKEVDKLKKKLEDMEQNIKIKQINAATSFNTERQTRAITAQDKRKIRQLQHLLQKKHVDLATQRRRISLQHERQKRYLTEQNIQLREELKMRCRQFERQQEELILENQRLTANNS